MGLPTGQAPCWWRNSGIGWAGGLETTLSWSEPAAMYTTCNDVTQNRALCPRQCTFAFWGWSSRYAVESSWNVMAHGDEREGKWRGNWRMEWVSSTLHTTSEHGVYPALLPLTPRLPVVDWTDAAPPPRRFKWTRPFRRKTKSGFCACAITFQTQSTSCLITSLTDSNRAWLAKTEFYVLFTVHLGSVLVNNHLDAQFFFSYIFIPILYMFRAPLCSSSGE